MSCQSVLFLICFRLLNLFCSPFIRGYESLCNMRTYQEGVIRGLSQGTWRGEKVFFINAHSFTQVTAYCPGASQVIIVERVLCTESKVSRSVILEQTVRFLRRIHIGMASVTFVMDQWCRVPLISFGVTVHPILSTARKHLGLRLMKTFQQMSVTVRETLEKECSVIGYQIVRTRLNVYTSEQYENWQVLHKYDTFKSLPLSSTSDWSLITGHISQLFSDQLLLAIQTDLIRDGTADPDMEYQYLKPILQNSLNCVMLLAALHTDNRDRISVFGRKFLHLVNRNIHRVSGFDVRTPDILRTIAHLVVKAEADINFSVNSFNMILSYAVRRYPLTEARLTQGFTIPRVVQMAQFEKVTLPSPITVLPVLHQGDPTIARVIDLCTHDANIPDQE